MAFSARLSAGLVALLLAGAHALYRIHEIPPLLRNDTRSLEHFIVVPEHKLLFCYIEKVGCMNFNKLFTQVRSRYDSGMLENTNPWYRNTPSAHGLSKSDLEQMLINKNWHKAVFYREPLERFASAFRSKCEGVDQDGCRHCGLQFGKYSVPFSEAALSMLKADERPDECHDDHFRQQREFCGGLDETLQYYDTVEKLDWGTSRAKVSALLQQVGIEPTLVPMFDNLFPDNGGSDSGHRHTTHSEEVLLRYYAPSRPYLAAAVADHYAGDYRLFGERLPVWAQIQVASAPKPATLSWMVQPAHCLPYQQRQHLRDKICAKYQQAQSHRRRALW